MGCRKIGYVNKREAKVALRQCRAANSDGYTWREEQRVYRCHCGSWHLASTPNWNFEGAQV